MPNDKEYISRVEQALQYLKEGNGVDADKILRDLTLDKESDLFNEIGKLTRELHEALNNFKLDARISDMAAQDIPEAKDRLEYVLTMTQNAANKTMDAADFSSDISHQMTEKAQKLKEFWDKVNKKQVNGEEFKAFFEETGDFLNSIIDDSGKFSSNMTDIIMAQDFQDLTGQVIKKIITLVQDVEESLVATIKMFGQLHDYQKAAATEKKIEEGVEGPQIDADNREDVVSNQDDVDDILSSLGF